MHLVKTPRQFFAMFCKKVTFWCPKKGTLDRRMLSLKARFGGSTFGIPKNRCVKLPVSSSMCPPPYIRGISRRKPPPMSKTPPCLRDRPDLRFGGFGGFRDLRDFRGFGRQFRYIWMCFLKVKPPFTVVQYPKIFACGAL